MKLLLSVLALETASKEMGIRYCGQMKGQSGHLQDELSLRYVTNAHVLISSFFSHTTVVVH